AQARARPLSWRCCSRPFTCSTLAALLIRPSTWGRGRSSSCFSTPACLAFCLPCPIARPISMKKNLPTAVGLRPGETAKVLHEGRETGVSAGPVKALALGTFASAAVMTATTLKWVRENWFFPGGQPMRLGLNVSLLGFGSGLLVGFRICLAMGIGTLISWVILPPFLMSHGMITALDFASTLRWVMWPATGLMVAGGLVSLALKWNLIVKTFRGLKGSRMEQTDFPMQ